MRLTKPYGHSKLANLLFNRGLSLSASGTSGGVIAIRACRIVGGSNIGSATGVSIAAPVSPGEERRDSLLARTAGYRGEYLIKCRPPDRWRRRQQACRRQLAV